MVYEVVYELTLGQHMALTIRECDNFKYSKKQYVWSDGGGLIIRASPKQNEKIWLYRYTFNGKRTMVTLGNYKVLGLKEARKERDKLKALLSVDIDPRVEKQKHKFKKVNTSSVTFNQAYNDTYSFYSTKKVDAWSKGHKNRCKSIYNNYLVDTLGKLPLTEITDEMILQVLEGIYKKAPVTCQKAKHLISVVFNFAKDKRIFKGFNPVMHLKGNSLIAPTEAKHHRELPVTQVGEFLDKNNQYPNIYIKSYLYVMLTTALRVTSLRKTTWGMYDKKTNAFHIPSENMKGRKFFRCPLPSQAIPILDELRKEGDKPNEIIFKGNSKVVGEVDCISSNTPNIVIRSFGFDANAHGIRTTFTRTLTKSKQYSIEVIEAQMSHKFASDIRLAYMGGEDYFDERKEAVQYFADWCDKQLAIYKGAINNSLST